MRKVRNLDYINWYNNQNYDRITIINEFLLKLIPQHLVAERIYIGRTE